MNWWRRPVILEPKIVVWTRQPMTEEEMATALGQWDGENRQRQAVEQILQQMLDEATAAIGNPELNAERLRHGAGVIDALQGVQQKLGQYLP